MPTLTVILDSQGSCTTIEVSPDESLLAALERNKLYVKSSCGGVASCGDCVVKILSGADALTPPCFDETGLLGNVFHITGERLSCQAKAKGKVILDISGHDKGRDQEEMKKRTSSGPPRRQHKVRKSEAVESLKKERLEQQKENRSWERHWEKGNDSKTPLKKQGGHRRPRPFRTDHLEQEVSSAEGDSKKDPD